MNLRPLIIASLLGAQAVLAQNWTTLTTGTSNKIYTLQFVTPDTGWIGGEGSLIRKTVDGGVSWTAQAGSRNITAIRFLDTHRGWAVGGSANIGVALKTVNGGTTWTSQITTGPVLWDVRFLDSARGWIVGAKGALSKTWNGGTTWTTVNTGITTDLRRLHLADSLNAWIVGSSGLILRTSDGGSTWTTQSSGVTSALVDITFPARDTGWIVGVGGVIRKTTNGGATWAAQTSGLTTDLLTVTFLNTQIGFAAGAGGNLVTTRDGGATWTAENSGSNVGINALQMFPSGLGYSAGETGTARRLAPTVATLTAYRTNPATYSTGVPITANTPVAAGSSPMVFRSNPALPPGLSLDSATGILSGTPTQTQSPTAYSIVATNLYGSSALNLVISVLNPPSNFTYSFYPAPQYIVGTAITPNLPTVSGHVSLYTVSPALPAGLSLDSLTGIISGTPTGASASANYTLTARNASGASATVVLNITVSQKPSNLSYATNPATYRPGVAITANLPSIQGGGSVIYSVSPSLPAGLTLHPLTGALSGTPSAQTAQSFYTVTASNSVGSTICVLVLTVEQSAAMAPRRLSGHDLAFTAPGDVRMSFSAPIGATSARVEVFNLQARTVYTGTQTVGKVLPWNGHSTGGAVLSNGFYGVRITWIGREGTATGFVSRRFLLMQP
jgi:photosystem II stability/assembly factor-like uncharacterized protein